MVGNAPLYDEPVYALAAVYDRYLVIGGEFDALRAGGVDLVRGLNGMALFDTQERVDPAAPLSGYLAMAGVKRASGTGRVRALQVLGGELFVGGDFRAAGPTAAGGVAVLDPTAGTWSTYGSGIGGGLRGVTHVEAVALDVDGALWVAGTFNTAGGKVSCSIARCGTAAENPA